MKHLTTLLLLFSLLLSVLASCQGAAPAASLPATETPPQTTKGEAPPASSTVAPPASSTVAPPPSTTQQGANQPSNNEMTLSQAVKVLEEALRTAPKEREDGSYEYLVSENLAQAILCVKENAYSFASNRGYSIHYSVRKEADALRNYFIALDQVAAETNCSIVFENTVAFRAEGGAYYLPDSSGHYPNLYCFRDRGITKEFFYTVDYENQEIVYVYPYAFADNSVLETVTIDPPKNHFLFPESDDLVYAADVLLGKCAFANCPSLRTVNIPGNEIRENEPSRQYDPTDGQSSLNRLFYDGYPDYGVSVAPAEEEWVPGEFPLSQKSYKKVVLTNNIVDENPANFVVKDGVLLAYVGIGGHVVIPEGVTEIRSGVFAHCNYNVLSVTFPSTLKKICTWAFYELPIVLLYEFPESLEVIEAEAFNLGGQPFFLVTGIPEDCKVAENAFPLDWMADYGKKHPSLPEGFVNYQTPNTK